MTYLNLPHLPGMSNHAGELCTHGTLNNPEFYPSGSEQFGLITNNRVLSKNSSSTTGYLILHIRMILGTRIAVPTLHHLNQRNVLENDVISDQSSLFPTIVSSNWRSADIKIFQSGLPLQTPQIKFPQGTAFDWTSVWFKWEIDINLRYSPTFRHCGVCIHLRN